MKNKFIISENDRRSILSMYGVLNESLIEYTFKGVVKDSSTDQPVIEKSPIKIVEKDSNKTIGGGVTDIDGKFNIKIKLDNTKSYYFKILAIDTEPFTKDIDLTLVNQEVNFEVISKLKNLEGFDLEQAKLTNLNISVTNKNNKPLTDFRLKIIVGDEEILDKEYSSSNINLNILDNGLILNDLTVNQEYPYNTEDDYIFSSRKRGDIEKVKFIINKPGYTENTINYDVKILNGSFSAKIINKSEWSSALGEKEFRFFVKTGNEDITISDTYKNDINLIYKSPDELKSIKGRLKIDLPSDSFIDQEELSGGPKGLKINFYGVKSSESQLIGSTISKENGEFEIEFDDDVDIRNFDNFKVTTEGNYLFKNTTKELSIGDIRKDTTFQENEVYDLGSVTLERGGSPLNVPTISSFCKTYDSNKKRIFGFGKSTNISNSDALKSAINDAMKNLITFRPEYENYAYFISQNPKTYKVICNKATRDKREVVIKLNAKVLRGYLKKENTPTETPKINFKDLNFIDAISLSNRLNKKLFLLFTGDDNKSNSILNRLNSNENMIKDLNDNFIPLNYSVDISQKNKYLIASETLRVFTYPYLVVLEGVKDPNEVENLKDSYRILNKYGSMDDLYQLNVDTF